MSIKYKLTQKGEPGVAGGGTKKWYASVVTDGEMSTDDLVKAIEKFSALSEADIKGVIIALENVIQDALADSKIVRLEKLGTLYPRISSEGVTNKHEFIAKSHIRATKVLYKPGNRIANAMKNAGFERRE